MVYAWWVFYRLPGGGQGGSSGCRGDLCAALLAMGRTLLRLPEGACGYGEIRCYGRLAARVDRDATGRTVWRWP